MCSSFPSKHVVDTCLRAVVTRCRRRCVPSGHAAASLVFALLLSYLTAGVAGAQMSAVEFDGLPDLRSAMFRADSEAPHKPMDAIGIRAIPENHTPRGALWRAAVVPGWGQIYNRQYVKLPFVYGAMGGLVAAIISLDNDYDLYNRAFQYKAFQELVDAGQLDENPRASFQSSYDRIASDVGPVSSRPLEIRRNNLRRGRDLSAIGLGLVYGLAMLDAYVSAHLLDFDVGENLGVAVTPGADGFRFTARVPLQRTRE